MRPSAGHAPPQLVCAAWVRKMASGSTGDETKASKEEPKDPKGAKGEPGGEGPQQPNWTVGAAGAAFAAVLSYWYFAQETEEVTIQDLIRNYLMKGYVDKIQIVNRSFCRVGLRGDAPDGLAGRQLTIQLGTPEAFESKLEQAQSALRLARADHVPIQYVSEFDYGGMLLAYGPSMLIIVSLMLGLRGMMNGNPMGGFPGAGGMGGPMGGSGGRTMFNMGKAFPDGNKGVKSKVRFTDVAGCEQAKLEVVEFVDFLKDSAKYTKLGARIPKGGLLVGPPGTGKTLLAKAVAGEADCPFFAMSGSDFVEMFGGVGASRMRDLFKTARESAPSIIFIDEIDAVGRKRSSGGFSGGGNDERENTLNQMLVEMDGFSTTTGVVVLAGTNRVDILDQALLRPGRFDRQIAVDKPDLNEREAIFLVHLKPVKLHKDLPKEPVARRMATLTPGMVGADIANICNEAAIVAARRESQAVEMEDFERATERVLAGLPKARGLLGERERRTVALHESGHAVAGWFLQHADPLLKVSIMPRSGGALGFAQYLPQEMALHSREAILDKIAMSLGGRAAEELFVGKISTGASDDLDKVTKMAYSMVSVYGMNPELGLLSYRQQRQGDTQFYKPYSEETGRLMDREARQVVDQEYQRVKALLVHNTQVVNALAEALLARETLVYSDLLQILGERPWAMQEEYAKFFSQAGSPFAVPLAVDSEAAGGPPESTLGKSGLETEVSTA